MMATALACTELRSATEQTWLLLDHLAHKNWAITFPCSHCETVPHPHPSKQHFTWKSDPPGL